MTSPAHTPLNLPPEAAHIVWRILGNIASPEVQRDTPALIEDVVRKKLPSALHDPVIAEIRGWYQQSGERHWLRSELTEPVAHLIADGVGTGFEPDRLWAIGALDVEVMHPLFAARWSDADIDRFCDATIALLENICARDLVLDPRALRSSFGADARVSKSAFAGHSALDRYNLIETRDPSLARDAIHLALTHLVELCLGFRPDRLGELIRRADHPSIRLFAADTVDHSERVRDHRHTLTWITGDACDDLIVLAILKTLHTVTALDGEHEYTARRSFDPTYHHWGSELRPPTNIRAAAGNLLDDLVKRLDGLGPPAALHQQLAHPVEGGFLVRGGTRANKSDRLEQLEQACRTVLLQRLAAVDDFAVHLAHLLRALRRPPRDTNLRHLGPLAWDLRHQAPDRSAALADSVLTDYTARITAEVKKGHFFFNLESADEWSWLLSIGMAIALIKEDPLTWVHDRITELPLTAWDAEEDFKTFYAAQDAADHLMIAGLRSIECRVGLAGIVPREAVMRLFELYWAHREFIREAGSLGRSSPDIVAELMVRIAAKHGDLGETIVFELLQIPRQHPRVLTALLEARPLAPTLLPDIVDTLTLDFETRLPKSPDYQYWWGRVWQLLAQPQSAYLTLRQTEHSRRQQFTRPAQTLFLKLALLVFEKFDELDPELGASRSELIQRIHRQYDALWAYEADQDPQERQGIVAALQRLGLRLPDASP